MMGDLSQRAPGSRSSVKRRSLRRRRRRKPGRRSAPRSRRNAKRRRLQRRRRKKLSTPKWKKAVKRRTVMAERTRKMATAPAEILERILIEMARKNPKVMLGNSRRSVTRRTGVSGGGSSVLRPLSLPLRRKLPFVVNGLRCPKFPRHLPVSFSAALSRSQRATA